MKRRKGIIIFTAGVMVILLPQLAWRVLKSIMPECRTIQVLQTADRKHTAELQRLYRYIDVNFRIKFDGKQIYRSPDFAPNDSISFEESLYWDKSGQILLFRVAGHAIFGYDITKNKRLSDLELIKIEPDKPELWQYGYEAEWPGIGRARKQN